MAPARLERTNACVLARSAAPSSLASRAARAASPRASREHASSRWVSSPSSRSAITAAGSGSKRTCRQREAIVGITSAGRSVSSSRCTNAAGSSSVFSMRLAACSLSVCAASITNTRRADSNGVRAAAATTGCSMSATSISVAPDAVTHVRSG